MPDLTERFTFYVVFLCCDLHKWLLIAITILGWGGESVSPLLPFHAEMAHSVIMASTPYAGGRLDSTMLAYS